MKRIIIGSTLSFIAIAWLSSCASIPKNAKPVSDFELDRYLGAWYEIARFDYRFEKDLDNVVAKYSLKDNGEIRILNSGYNVKTGEWKSAAGSAKSRTKEPGAALKVSFFKPFYSGYNVIAIDENYKYALVAGRNLNYLWLLSREKTMPEHIKQEYLQMAEDIGYDTSRLIWVKQDRENPFINEQ